MKGFVVLVCLYLASSGICDFGKNERNLAVSAIHEVILKYFVKSCPKVDILIVGVQNGFAATTANDLLHNFPEGIAVKVRMTNDMKRIEQLETSTVLLFDSVRKFKEKKSLPGTNWFGEAKVWHKHLLYAPGLKIADIQKKFKNNANISAVNFLINSDRSSVELATSFLFTPQECHVNQIKTINKFTRATNRWENGTFYPDKYRNFHGCTIKIRFHPSKTSSIGKNIFETLAQQLNFKLLRTKVTLERFNKLHINNDLTEKMLKQSDRTMKQSLSSAIFIDSINFVVPPGEPFTDMERMFAAFDTYTWIAIGATFGIATVVILFINFMSRSVQNFVYGRNNRTPALNLASIFLNGGQARTPGRNFARFLLMLFIMWSIIFRTCYQSKMFEHMNSDLRHPPVKTFEDLRDRNFSLVYHEYSKRRFARKFASELAMETLPDENEWFNVVAEPANKCTSLWYRAHYYSHLKMFKRFAASTSLLEENVLTLPFFIVLPRFVPYTEVFIDKIDEMLANGFIQKLYDQKWLIERDEKRFEFKIEPRVLTVDSLRLGFLAFLIALMLSFFVFIAEFVLKSVCLAVSRAF